jgi:molybdopterin-guanine dinucleotide biosynthesis protein A
VRKLLDGLGDASVAVAHDGNKEQPLIFLALTTALTEIDAYLKTGRRSVKGWLDGMNHNRIYFANGSSSFENINMIEQLE